MGHLKKQNFSLFASNMYRTYTPQGIGSKWRNFQRNLKATAARKRIFKKIVKLTIPCTLFIILTLGLIYGIYRFALKSSFNLDTDHSTQKLQQSKPLIGKEELQAFLNSEDFINLEEKSIVHDYEGRHVRIDTCLDTSLQHFLLNKLDRKNSRYIGIVAMDPKSGRILSMVGFDKIDPAGNPCLRNSFPAASIFKIVTATAAIEKCGFDPETEFTYNGGKYTLYRSQLRERKNRYTRRITLRDSFAQSVNPVFGKIGAHHLEKSDIEEYAAAFGFNRHIDFEIPIPSSVFTLRDEPYHKAEIASGFNRNTILTPLHAALMVAAILNSGQMLEPTIVDQITDNTGNTIYQSRITPLQQACARDSTHILKELMHETISSGTCKKAFRDHKRDPILSRLYIGGKTGSISNKAHDARFDWFVGFAEAKDDPVKIAVSVVVAHEDYIGIRANRYFRMMIKHYFGKYFAKLENKAEQILDS
jgi:cell division protein FtsI/penicillin-binding protein 2